MGLAHLWCQEREGGKEGRREERRKKKEGKKKESFDRIVAFIDGKSCIS
jgi:hypothetical protein